MKTNRRDFLKHTGVGVGLAATGWEGSSTASARGPAELAARKKAAHRGRRIIFNNDGADAWEAVEPTVESFLAARSAPCIDTQVDSVFYDTTHDTGMYTHRTGIGETYMTSLPGMPSADKNVHIVKTLVEQGTDPLEITVNYLREHGKEVLWCHRMNGMEDMVAPDILSPWKRDHPEWWLGKSGDDKKYPPGDPRHWYRVVDYAVAEVRKFMLAVTGEVIENYDVDGVQLDYMRDPWLFKETFGNPVKPVPRDKCTIMVDFHKKLRAMLDAKSARVGRPLLLALRVPKYVDISRDLGLDIEENLKSGVVDVLIGGGGYTPFAVPPTEFIELAHRYEVPAYISISSSGMMNRQKWPDSRRTELLAWRGAATNLWDAGVDGQYIFNTWPKATAPIEGLPVMREIGDPRTMAGKEMLFTLDNWDDFAGAGYCNHAFGPRGLLPIALPNGPDRNHRGFHVGLGNDVLKRSMAKLRVYTSGQGEADGVSIRLNSEPVGAGQRQTTYIDFALKPGQVRHGANRLSGSVRRAGHGKPEPVKLIHFKLTVQPS